MKTHPLLHTWTLWYYEKSNKNWVDSLQKVHIVNSVEQFWNLFFNIKTPTQLKNNTGYLFFKGNNKPIVELYYKNGGKWIFMINLDESIDYFWINMLMCVISEGRGDFDMLNGIYIYKTADKIAIQVWINNINKQKEINIIATKLRKYSNFKNSIYYLPHDKKLTSVKYQTVGKMKCLYYNV